MASKPPKAAVAMNMTRASVTRAWRRARRRPALGRQRRLGLDRRRPPALRAAGRVSGTRTMATTALTTATRGGHEERQVRAAERGQPTDGRAEHEADAEGRAEQAEQPGPLGRAGPDR